MHREKRDPNNLYDDGPALIPAIETNDMLKRYKYEETERAYDMYKLSWSILERPPVSNPESFNVHGFDETAFEKERKESLEAAERASEEKTIRKRAFQEKLERSVDQLIKEISEWENR